MALPTFLLTVITASPNKTKLTGPPPPTLATIDARTGGSG